MKPFILDPSCGNTFSRVAEEAKSITDQHPLVHFDFNGITCIVTKHTNLEWLWNDYAIAHLMDWKEVTGIGEYPPSIQKEIKARQIAAEEKAEIQRKEYAAKEKIEQEAFDKKVEGIVMEFSDKEAWDDFVDKNQDPYGSCCVKYAEGWAKLMQAEFAQGKNISDCAEKTSFELGFLGITGFMYGCAVSMLSKCWKHGEALRLWHNLKTQIGNEGEKANDSGGVLNPALLSIG